MRIAYEWIEDDLLVFVHGKDDPLDSEWVEVLDMVEAKSLVKPVKSVIYSHGGRPNSEQRSWSKRVTNIDGVSAAVMTENRALMSVVAVFKWIVGDERIRAFRPGDITKALHWLGYRVSIERSWRVRNALERLSREVRT